MHVYKPESLVDSLASGATSNSMSVVKVSPKHSLAYTSQ